MAEDRIDQAIDMATTGDPGQAIRLLWADMLVKAKQNEVMFALAFCFEKSNNFATANYLYEELVLRRPSFEVGVERQQACRKMVEEKGLIEDFEDMGHRECIGCELRYRSEYILCPYCGTSKDAKEVYAEKGDSKKSEELPGWEDPSILGTMEGMGRDVADRIQKFVESDTVKEISEKVVATSLATGRKAKEFAKNENVKKATEKTVGLGKDFVDKTEKLSETSTIRGIAQKIEDASWSASNKMKEMTTPESRKKVADKAQEVGKTLLDKVRKVIDPPKKGE